MCTDFVETEAKISVFIFWCRIVTAFRQWFEERAGGGPIPEGARDATADRIEPSRAVLLDRYSSHTRHCKSCSRVSHCKPLIPNILLSPPL